jgi:hypothetical protein
MLSICVGGGSSVHRAAGVQREDRGERGVRNEFVIHPRKKNSFGANFPVRSARAMLNKPVS